MKKKLLIIISLLLFFNIVKADTGTKPSIELTIENLNTKNYIVDLLEYDDGEHYKGKMDYNGNGLSEEEILRLYKINYDGWISSGVRWNDYLIFADCAGNKNHKHTFSYFGTPVEYKVLIINLDDNTEKISDKIIREDYNSVVSIDYNTMKLIKTSTNSHMSWILKFILILLTTILIEFFTSLLFKIKNYKLILLVNFISNSILQILMTLLDVTSIYMFIIMEILVIIFELICYLKLMKNTSKKRIAIYTILANTITALLTFIM